MKRRLASQDGWVMLAALLVMVVMVGFGLATLSVVDTQQHSSGIERTREAAFDIAEGVLQNESFLLSAAWPGTQGPSHPSCTSTTVATGCPDPTAMARTFQGIDATGATWTTDVFDNGGTTPNFYSDSLVAGQPHYDANGDNQLWVRATATSTGRTRRLVALVKFSQNPAELFPFSALIAGHFSTTNKGNKLIVDSQGSSAQPSPVDLRCTNILDTSCLDAVVAGVGAGANNKIDQIGPGPIVTGYTGGSALSPAAIGRLRATAQALGSYYATGCPANPSGLVVFIENGNCVWNNSVPGPCCNSPTRPGIVVIANGSAELGGNLIFYGELYDVNAQNASGNLITTSGTAAVVGSVAVDGNGGVMAGSSGASQWHGANIVYDANAVASIRTFGTTGIVQNTWRELQ